MIKTVPDYIIKARPPAFIGMRIFVLPNDINALEGWWTITEITGPNIKGRVDNPNLDYFIYRHNYYLLPNEPDCPLDPNRRTEWQVGDELYFLWGRDSITKNNPPKNIEEGEIAKPKWTRIRLIQYFPKYNTWEMIEYKDTNKGIWYIPLPDRGVYIPKDFEIELVNKGSWFPKTTQPKTEKIERDAGISLNIPSLQDDGLTSEQERILDCLID